MTNAEMNPYCYDCPYADRQGGTNFCPVNGCYKKAKERKAKNEIFNRLAETLRAAQNGCDDAGEGFDPEDGSRTDFDS